MTQRELLVNTVKFYTSENRALAKGACIYLKTKTSPGCAIGRHLTPEVQQVFHKIQVEDNAGSINSICEDPESKKLLPDWMQEMNIGFLKSVQQLHDSSECWDIEGISALGKQEVFNLCILFNLEFLTEEESKHVESI